MRTCLFLFCLLLSASPLFAEIELVSVLEQSNRRLFENVITYRGRMKSLETTYQFAKDREGRVRLIVLIIQPGDCHLNGCRADFSLGTETSYMIYDDQGLLLGKQSPKKKPARELSLAIELLKQDIGIIVDHDVDGKITSIRSGQK